MVVMATWPETSNGIIKLPATISVPLIKSRLVMSLISSPYCLSYATLPSDSMPIELSQTTSLLTTQHVKTAYGIIAQAGR
jgi:hypothetical protein